jgi:hypothetical protein
LKEGGQESDLNSPPQTSFGKVCAKRILSLQSAKMEGKWAGVIHHHSSLTTTNKSRLNICWLRGIPGENKM